jgi:hypothetical protein
MLILSAVEITAGGLDGTREYSSAVKVKRVFYTAAVADRFTTRCLWPRK